MSSLSISFPSKVIITSLPHSLPSSFSFSKEGEEIETGIEFSSSRDTNVSGLGRQATSKVFGSKSKLVVGGVFFPRHDFHREIRRGGMYM
jgi:hypothetical protein